MVERNEAVQCRKVMILVAMGNSTTLVESNDVSVEVFFVERVGLVVVRNDDVIKRFEAKWII
jgi:hypothetical protein